MARPPARIALIAVYLGPLPPTFDFFLRSAGENPTVDFLIVHDDVRPRRWPANVRSLPSGRAQIRARAAAALGFPVPLDDVRKLCDLKPLYGLLFAEEIGDCAFWGFIDLDVIWGDLACYLTPEVLTIHDLITADARRISGPFTIVRNDARRRELCRSIPDLHSLLASPVHLAVDERHFDRHVRARAAAGECRCLYSHREGAPRMQDYGADSPDAAPRRFPASWRDGRLTIHAHGGESMMLHLLRVADSMTCEPADAWAADTWIVNESAIVAWPIPRPG
jgi:hypothetical protein